MTYISLSSCERYCLTSCYNYYTYFRLYFLLFVSIIVTGIAIYSRYKRRQGFKKEKVGPCCFKYVKDPQQHEMRQIIYIGDEEGAITQVGQNFVLVPTNEARRQKNVISQESAEQVKAPNTAPQF